MALENLESVLLRLKADMHLHTKEDPYDKDVIDYSAFQLIDHLDMKGFDVFSITLHDFMFDERMMRCVRKYAKSKGMLFIPGIEKTIEEDHILIYNMRKEDAESLKTYKDIFHMMVNYGLREKEEKGAREKVLIVAAHPFFPSKTAIDEKLDQWHNVLHGLEFNSFYPRFNLLNFNQKGIREARKHYKVMIGNTDAHVLQQIGNTFTIIPVKNEAFTRGRPPYVQDKRELKQMIRDCSEEQYDRINKVVIHYIKNGSPQVVTKPLSLAYIAWYIMRKF